MLRKLIFIMTIVTGLIACSGNQDQKEKVESAGKNNVKDTTTSLQISDSLKMKSPEPDAAKPNENTKGPEEEIKSAEPVPQKLDVSKMAMEFFSRGVQHYEEKKYQQGIAEFNKVVQMDPDNKDAFYNLGMGYYFTEDYYHALKNFREAARLDPQDSLSVLYCGLAKYFLGDFEGSIEYFDQAIELNPGFSDAWYNRGTARGQINDYTGAIADFTKAIDLKPDYKEAYYNRGNAYFFANERDKACADWKKAKSLGSENTDKVLEAYCQEN
ncbi:MAG: tetratricopeptide repeat protein [Bacteroidales bacterium]|nr:tetratricopeptide repeat protein [Bacteroidales bacterium]MCF8345338.1 tetratricopeptide repeat protein [Bacteroidales bacterium]MCF8350100.1 tetratricopeptide repeat protein [Bacteroidales bacterium]MCF8376158.1 tetratricopeptide repeat protein [Bacteroidales bacterium]